MTTEPTAHDLNLDDIRTRLDFASTNTMPCAKLALQWFNDPALSHDTKSDGTPVTIADQTIESELRRRIAFHFPDDTIKGEEHPDTPGSSDYTWILDPIDGTISFVHGIPLFGTMVACLYKDTPVLGAIAMPCLDEIVFGATGLGAFHQHANQPSKAALVSQTPSLDQALVNTTSLSYFTTPELRSLYERIDAASKHTRGLPDCYAIVLLATGRVDAVIEPSVSLWDIASVPPIITEAGGTCTDIQGTRSVHTNSLLAGSPKIHEQLLSLINS